MKNNKNYAIARIKKHGSGSRVHYLLNHHLRTSNVPNADPELKGSNQILMKVQDPKKFIADVPAGTKKNACRFVDVLFTATKFDSPEQLKKWTDATLNFARDKFGKDNIALAVLHLDETTPHIHIIFKPINPKTGKLGAGYWFDGRAKMQKFQDDYHKKVAHLGFDRGEPGSRARHQTIKQFYKKLNSAEQNYKDELLQPIIEEHKKVEEMGFFKKISWLNNDLKKFLGKMVKVAKPAFLLAEMADKKEMERLKEIEKKQTEQQKLLEATQERLLELTGSKLPSSTEVRKAVEKVERVAEHKTPEPTKAPNSTEDPKKKNSTLPKPTMF